MDDVKPVHRYKAQTMFSFGGAKIEYFPHGPEVVLATEFDAMKRQYAELEARYSFLRTVTPHKFKKMQEASTTDGGDVLYFHSDRFDAQIDTALTKETENKNHE
ncbi:hypothetical protein [Pseudomonas koreensis]|uniref:hypothetical protein n=1 Tax=Pseudomonas koreensis TaxID=198620 RepID=UPI0018E69349|nr:hypothetical protein [Pseudomonas koreensis]MBI6948564.1 hypothetical protein [Pseudomonas koreensis]